FRPDPIATSVRCFTVAPHSAWNRIAAQSHALDRAASGDTNSRQSLMLSIADGQLARRSEAKEGWTFPPSTNDHVSDSHARRPSRFREMGSHSPLQRHRQRD